jgi:hypothetical protein
VIVLTKGQIQNVYFTLTEKQTISAPNYLFVFEQRSTNTEVKFVLTNAKDLSSYKDRYNKFLLNVNQYFLSKLNGQYTYSVYQQTSATNTTTTGLTLLESGIMMLKETEEVYTEYTTTDTYKIRQ